MKTGIKIIALFLIALTLVGSISSHPENLKGGSHKYKSQDKPKNNRKAKQPKSTGSACNFGKQCASKECQDYVCT